MSETSIPDGVYCIYLKLYSIGAAEQKNEEIVSSSSLLSGLTFKNNPYAIVKNQFGFVVGQLLSDGVKIEISQTQFFSSRQKIFPRKQNTVNSNNFTICIDARNDITNFDKDFPILDFAETEDLEKWFPLKLTNITKRDSKYCKKKNFFFNLIFYNLIFFFNFFF